MKKRIAAVLSGFLLCCSLQGQTYAVTDFIDSLDLPIAFDFAPDGRVFLTQKGTYNLPVANAQIRVYDSAGQMLSVFYDLSDSVKTNGENGLLGLALDPDFANNHFVYAYYNHSYNSSERFRIIRFTEQNNLGTNPLIIFDHPMPPNVNIHVAGNIHFRPSEPNHLYFVIGELGDSSNAQQLDRPYGKVLRILKNGGIPADNPFYDDGNPLTGNDDRIWSYGHRNPFDFCFSPENDSLYISENGRLAWDEINVGSRGLNYGWPYCEGAYTWNSTTTFCNNPLWRDPIAGWCPTVGLTGITWYHDTAMPEFDHHLLVADFNGHNIYDLIPGNAPEYDTVLSRTTWLSNAVSQGISALHAGPDGCVYAAVLGFYPAGKIVRICHATAVEEIHADIFGLSAAPVPVSGQAVISFILRKDEMLDASLYDMQGREISGLFHQSFRTGKNEWIFQPNAQTIAPGCYFLQVRSSGGAAVLKLLLQ